MDAAGVEKAALLGWGGPGPELAAFFAATYPDRALCLSLAGSIHERQESDYPWGDPPEAFEEDLARVLRSWGSESGAADFVRSGHPDQPVDSPPYDDPGFLRWTAKLARYAATPASYEAFVRMWYGTDVRPALRAISAPTACFFAADDSPDDEDYARYQASLIPVR